VMLDAKIGPIDHKSRIIHHGPDQKTLVYSAGSILRQRLKQTFSKHICPTEAGIRGALHKKANHTLTLSKGYAIR